LEHFHGISPRRFRDIFEKGKRKSKNGGANIWYEETPKPLIGERFSTHVLLEVGFMEVFSDVLEKLRKDDAENLTSKGVESDAEADQSPPKAKPS